MNRLFVDNLTVIDFAYLDPTRGLVGESWIVDVELSGELDDQGMVFDFGLVKRTIKQLIDDQADHRLLVPQDYTGLEWQESGNEVRLTWRKKDGGLIEHSSPQNSLLPTPGDTLSTDTLARHLEVCLRAVLPDNVAGVSIRLREEQIEGPYYHYVHGLKKHDGNCQRIAHGHRSRLLIERDGSRAPELERMWAERWQDIYIATEEDLVDSFEQAGRRYHRFAYEANQGRFSLTLPEETVYLIPTDSTVEWIAVHLLQQCQSAEPDAALTIKAFEGVGKGAIAATRQQS